jgi:hypothetical protein
MDYTTRELFLFLKQISFYEEGLFDIIKKQIIWTPKNNINLKQVVKLYLNEDTVDEAIKKYNLMSLWDVSNFK